MHYRYEWMNMRVKRQWIVILGALCTVSAGPAQAQDAALSSAMSGRVVDITDAEGAQPQYDPSNAVKAGYFRLRIEPKGLSTATECPDSVLDRMAKADRNRWKAAGGKLVDVVFKRNYLWGIDATLVLRPDNAAAPDTATVNLSLITIKDPKSGNCQIKIGGKAGAPTVDYESFLVALGSGPANYSDKIQLNLNAGYSAETDKDRVALLWSGLVKPIAGAIFLPAAGVVDAVAPEAQAAIIDELNRNTLGNYPETFRADPGPGKRAHKIFVKLDFVNLPPVGGAPASISGGITIGIEYQASVFLNNANFYKDITDPPAKLLDAKIRTVSGDAQIAMLVNNSYKPIRYDASTTQMFDGGCAAAQGDLVKLGLSPVDVAVFLWAAARANSHPAISDHVWDIGCIKAAETDLAKVGIKSPTAPEGKRATVPQMHDAMDKLAKMIKLGAPDSDWAKRFAPKLTLITDEATRSLLKLDGLVVRIDRDAALDLIAKNFSNLGCYAPRTSSPDLLLPMRPDFPPPLASTDRASAAIGLISGGQGGASQPLILSFRFDPVVDGELAQVSTISIAARGGDVSPVVTELTQNRRPVSCTESWMDPIFPTAE
jgi:hypothetical protein